MRNKITPKCSLLTVLSLCCVVYPCAGRAQITGPIINDEEFKDAIPLLEDADSPLESIEDWERAQDSDQSEMLPDPAVNDPILAEPLPSIETFDADPPPTPAEDEEEAAEIRYKYIINGLTGDEVRGSDKKILAEIEGRFKGLSLLKDGDGKAANGAMVSTRLRQDRQVMLDLLQSEGYYDAAIKGMLQRPENPGELLTADIMVTPGARYSLGQIALEADMTEPSDLLLKSFPPKTGEAIVAARILAAEARISVNLPENGYPFVKIGQRDILLDPETLTGDYTLPVDTGPRAYFGKIIVGGDDPVFAADHIELLGRFKTGQIYTASRLDDLREALVGTSLFSTVSVEPLLSAKTAADGTAYADLLVRQDAGPQRSLSVAAGYDTGAGLRAEGSWTHRNLFPPEGALILSAVAGTNEQGASVTFRRSNAGRRDRAVQLQLSASRYDFDAYRAETIQLSGRISRESSPIWQKRWTYGFGFELIGTRERDFDLTSNNLDRDNYLIFALPGQLGYDRSNSLLNPTKGFKVNLRASPEVSLSGDTNIYARTSIEASAYQKIGNSFVVAGRGKIGSIVGADRADITPSRRYYGGGGGSVRGFGFQELGPKDPNDDPIGGRSLVEAAIEGRYRFGDYGVVAFVDAGQVYASSTPEFDDWRFGVGIGGRFYTNFGPIRLDVATPINRQPGEGLVAVYVSIGQAF